MKTQLLKSLAGFLIAGIAALGIPHSADATIISTYEAYANSNGVINSRSGPDPNQTAYAYFAYGRSVSTQILGSTITINNSNVGGIGSAAYARAIWSTDEAACLTASFSFDGNAYNYQYLNGTETTVSASLIHNGIQQTVWINRQWDRVLPGSLSQAFDLDAGDSLVIEASVRIGGYGGGQLTVRDLSYVISAPASVPDGFSTTFLLCLSMAGFALCGKSSRRLAK